MTEPFEFADKLDFYVTRSAYTPGQLAGLTDLPRTTIVNWLNGRVKRPRDWQPVVTLLAVLRLDELEANDLLQAINQPTIAELRVFADEKDRPLLDHWEASARPVATAVRPPFQVVADIPYFVGRQAILADLKEHLLDTAETKICTLQGMAGTGKTAVATRLAYQLRPHFPDGVLWARLDTSDTMTILHTFARAYGADVSQYSDVASRSRVVRELLADKRALIVLDNAMDSAGVEPLLPPTGRSAVLITTRRQDLRVAQAAKRFSLQSFGPDGEASQQLFAHFLGAEQAGAEAETLAEIAEYVGHLPLALTIVASRLAYEPGWTAVDFLARLRQSSRRLKELTSEDQNVRASFDASYSLAPVGLQSFFGYLSLFGGEDFSPEAAAAAAELAVVDAQDYLRDLYRLSLVQARPTGRYQLHPLLRDYARERRPDSVQWTPLAIYYTGFLNGHALGDRVLAYESDNISAVIEGAGQNGEQEAYFKLIGAFTPFLIQQGRYEKAQEYLTEKLAFATGQARLPTLVQLSQVARYFRNYDTADRYLDEAEPIAREVQDLYYESAIEAEKGAIAGCRGDYDGARRHFRHGLALARENDSPEMLIQLLKEMGASEVARGNFEEAESFYQEGLALAKGSSPAHEPMLLRCLGGLAVVRHRDYKRAEEMFRSGLDKAIEINSQDDMISLLNNLAVTAMQQERLEEARELLKEGLLKARLLLNQVGVAMLSNNMGRLAVQEGQLAEAEVVYEEGLRVAMSADHHELVVSLNISLGILAGRQERYGAAADYFETALHRAKAIEYRSGMLQSLVAWSWLWQEMGQNGRFEAVYRAYGEVLELELSAAEFAGEVDIGVLERPKIFYE